MFYINLKVIWWYINLQAVLVIFDLLKKSHTHGTSTYLTYSSPDFHSVAQFHLWLLLLAPCFDRPGEQFPLQAQQYNMSVAA